MEEIYPLQSLTQRFKILLGSKSPRRRELLEQICIPFEVADITGVKEIYPDTLEPEDVPGYLSELKFNGYQNLADDELLITADTVVILGKEILGKPHNVAEAIAMLRHLSDREHKVVTGVTLGTTNKRINFSTTSKVKFGVISDEDIKYYVNRFKPLDKAGAYGIQEWIGCVAVKGIEGSFYNVMGLPVYRLYHELQHF